MWADMSVEPREREDRDEIEKANLEKCRNI
jgi:hypothetical protein